MNIMDCFNYALPHGYLGALFENPEAALVSFLFGICISLGVIILLDCLFRYWSIDYNVDTMDIRINQRRERSVPGKNFQRLLNAHCVIVNDKILRRKYCRSLFRFYGADIMNIALPPRNYTAFLRAVWTCDIKLVKYMIRSGACVESKTSTGESAMYLAVFRVSVTTDSRKSFQTLEPLLSCLYAAGCDVNTTNYKGFTPLHVAVKEGNYFVTLWLLRKQANPDARSLECLQRPIDVARLFSNRSSEHSLIADLLDGHEARKFLY